MIDSIGSAVSSGPIAQKTTGQKTTAQNTAAADETVKKGRAVGHQAKAAIAEVRDSGAGLPANIQGKIASGIARGIDPAAIFAAIVETPETQEPPVEIEVPVETTETGGPSDDAGATEQEPDVAQPMVQTDGETFGASVTANVSDLTDAEAALALLRDANANL